MGLDDRHRFLIIERMRRYAATPFTLMVAPSRTGLMAVTRPEVAIAFTATASVLEGTRLVRVHDVSTLAPCIRPAGRLAALREVSANWD